MWNKVIEITSTATSKVNLQKMNKKIRLKSKEQANYRTK